MSFFYLGGNWSIKGAKSINHIYEMSYAVSIYE